MKAIRFCTRKNGKLVLRTLVVFLWIGVAYSCEKKSDLSEPKFEINYRMFTEGDTSLYSVTIYCTTFFPEEDLTSFISKGKWRDAYWYQPEQVLHNCDSLKVTPDIQGYAGCSYYYIIGLHFYDSSGNPYMRSYSKFDSIKNRTDADIRFYWPTDTTNFNRTD
jgi:hypothetical protein